MNKKYEQLKKYIDKRVALGAAMALFEWDDATLAPEESVENNAKIKGILAGESHKALINEEVKALLDELKDADDLNETEKKIVNIMLKEYEQLDAVTAEEYKDYNELVANSINAWEKAKESNDFSVFAPYLEKVIAFNKKMATNRNKNNDSLYNILLGDYEEGFTTEVLDKFFEELKNGIVPLAKQIKAKEDSINFDFLRKDYDIEKQKEFNYFLAEYIGFDFKKGVIAESAHPFTTNWHNKDVRITTHYYKNQPESAMFSTIHEGGHALYEMNIADKYTLTPLGTGTSMGVHESQSRFMENVIGRRESFWKPIYGKLQEMFSDNLSDVNLEDFMKAANRVEHGYIRTEADELTYSLHVIIRYEIEKLFMENDIDVNELPEIWNKKYEEYLGLKPRNVSEGILQDIHWSQGGIGYFPSYALGSAFAAQFFHKMQEEFDVDKALMEGKVDKITTWLKENIHQYGSAKNAKELLMDVTGEELNTKYYVEYLREKYSKLYDL
ncbi:MAG: carboxypeptidase M32 [Lachnospiraceae bacterium]|nr:carboxypeptidase M32 [Lachnospiraceae bacterium]